jgi:hypothetical protein
MNIGDQSGHFYWTWAEARIYHRGVALFYEVGTRSVLLFGGRRNDTVFNDLWRFSLDTHVWTQLDDGEGSSALPQMAGAAVFGSPIDGQISVLAGTGQSSHIGWTRKDGARHS